MNYAAISLDHLLVYTICEWCYHVSMQMSMYVDNVLHIFRLYEGWLKSFEPPILNEEMWPQFFSCEIYNMFAYLLNSYFVKSAFWSHSSRTSQEGLQHGSSQYRWRHHPSHSVFQSYVFRVWDYLKSEGARPGEYGRCETSWSPQSRIVAITTTNMWAWNIVLMEQNLFCRDSWPLLLDIVLQMFQ